MEEWFFRVERLRAHFDRESLQTWEDYQEECESQGLAPETQLLVSYVWIIQNMQNLIKIDIYVANRDKIGILTSEQAAKTIYFYNHMMGFDIYEEDLNADSKSLEDKFHEFKSVVNNIDEIRKTQQQTLEALNQSIWQIYNPFRDVTYYPVEGGLFPDKDDSDYLRWAQPPQHVKEDSSVEETYR